MCSVSGDVEDSVPHMDPYELLDPVDILSKLPKDFYEKIVSCCYPATMGLIFTFICVAEASVSTSCV